MNDSEPTEQIRGTKAGGSVKLNTRVSMHVMGWTLGAYMHPQPPAACTFVNQAQENCSRRYLTP